MQALFGQKSKISRFCVPFCRLTVPFQPMPACHMR
jgi:hypothetical protein